MKLQSLRTALLICSSLTMAYAQSGNQPTVAGAAAMQQPPAGSGINYHGGPVLGTVAEGPVNLYLIFYGNWAGTDAGGPALMQDFSSTIGGTPYWNIFTTYNKPAKIQNAVGVAGTVTDTGSEGVNLSDATLQLVVQKWINNGTFPADANGIYHVLTSSEVNETSGFCSAYCGFHGHMTVSGKDIKYSFIGNPVHCTAQGGVRDCEGLSSNYTQSPNSDPGVDAMISVIAHETGEAVTDPDLNAWWFTATGQEEGDICAYKYGTTFPVGNGSVANVTVAGKNYLIQQSWIGPANPSKVAGEKCALKFR